MPRWRYRSVPDAPATGSRISVDGPVPCAQPGQVRAIFVNALLVCTADFATAEGFGPDIELTRTQTIMQGATHCDFRYRRASAAP